MEGWVRLHRKLLSSSVFENEKLLKVFIWCLLKASHKEREQVIGLSNIELIPGQFVTGRKKAASELGLKESTTDNYLKALEKLNIISMKMNSKYRVITIENWEIYQSREEDVDSKITSDEQQIDNKVTANKQQVDTNKNLKKEKNNNICRFTPPTLEEVQLYCGERNNGIDAQRFIDFYSSKGWKVGNTKMKDWKAAIRTWENRNKKSEPAVSNNAVNLDQNGYMPIDAM
ncbi:transcriptional regulator [Cellulosilyticum sp. WCF-2]|uniref:transcriptional regulator n=1 Tax=Cellulosilyticum sp. WCF-2 TaxID=2497860 RepID=UPI00167FE62C|nr:transcriptional regulator [Cellulosilyticum sp. WCF-2]